MIAGGTEAAIHPLALASFGNATALSKRSGEPEQASRPFDAARDGFVMGEGAGIVILESLGHALRRGARIHGEVIGYGASSDAYHVVASHPEGEGAAQAMKRALRSAGVSPEQVDVISAHATSTGWATAGRPWGSKSVRRARLANSDHGEQIDDRPYVWRGGRRGSDRFDADAERRGDPADDQPDESRSRMRSGLRAERCAKGRARHRLVQLVRVRRT